MNIKCILKHKFIETNHTQVVGLDPVKISGLHRVCDRCGIIKLGA